MNKFLVALRNSFFLACFAAPGLAAREVRAMGARPGSAIPGPAPTPAPGDDPARDGGEGEQSAARSAIELGVNVAIAYAKVDPRYAPILAALKIDDAKDLEKFLANNRNGKNLRATLAQLLAAEAPNNVELQDLLDRNELHDVSALRDFLVRGGGADSPTGDADHAADVDALLGFALAAAAHDPAYAVWMDRLNVHDARELRLLIGGQGREGNLRSLILVLGADFLERGSMAGMLRGFVETAMARLKLARGDEGSNNPGSADDVIDLGALRGLKPAQLSKIADGL